LGICRRFSRLHGRLLLPFGGPWLHLQTDATSAFARTAQNKTNNHFIFEKVGEVKAQTQGLCLSLIISA
jgi:hypothetical protein